MLLFNIRVSLLQDFLFRKQIGKNPFRLKQPNDEHDQIGVVEKPSNNTDALNQKNVLISEMVQ